MGWHEHRTMVWRRAAVAALCLSVTWLAGALPASAQKAGAESGEPTKGAVLYAAGGCANCHTDSKNKGKPLAGGRPFETPFGTFFSPNITPDPTHGIGRWTDAEFIAALREGVAPDGSHFFPAFPYTSFTNMTDDDMLAIKRHIFTLPAVAQPNRPHDVPFPFDIRFGQVFWKMLFFKEGPYRPDASKSPEWNRGAYLVLAVAHCGECHTPRNMLGALDRERWMAGTARGEGPEGLAIPNITPDPDRGIGDWSIDQIVDYLGTGALPDGDYAGSLMYEVIDDGTDQLSQEDRRAIAVYLKSLPPR